MSEDHKMQIARAEQLIEIGDYRQAKSIGRELKPKIGEMGEDDAKRLKRILAVVGVDPAVVIGFAFTLGVIIFLFVKYVL